MFVCFISAQASAQKLSPAEAANSARKSTGGKVLKVKPSRQSNTDYSVKVLLPEGRVRNITVDGNSGKLKRRKKK